MKVLVCGGRNVGRTNPNTTLGHSGAEVTRATSERNFVSQYLTKIHSATPITQVIGGDEGGAERIGLNWAATNNIQTDVWARQKTTAGTVTKALDMLRKKNTSSRETMAQRNSRMLSGSKPDLVVSFGGGDSSSELVKQAKQKGIEVIEVPLPKF